MANARQVAVIPVRRAGGALEVCLIRRKDAEKWGIPKGFVERGDSPEEAALNEAAEEAGLKGEVQGAAIGEYQVRKTRYLPDGSALPDAGLERTERVAGNEIQGAAVVFAG